MYGLAKLADEMWELHQKDYSDEAIYEWLLEQEPYKEEFAGLVTLRKNGKAAGMGEGDYLTMRRQMSDMIRRSGFGGTSFDNKDYLNTVIGNEVSFEEFTDRIQLAEAASQTLPADVRAELRDRYGVTDRNVVAYYMETDRTEQDLIVQQEAAQLSAAYSRFQTGRIRTEALEEVARQVDESRAVTAMQGLGTLGGDLEDQKRLEGAFGLNRLVDLQRRQRLAAQAGGGGGGIQAEGVSGLGDSAMR